MLQVTWRQQKRVSRAELDVMPASANSSLPTVMACMLRVLYFEPTMHYHIMWSRYQRYQGENGTRCPSAVRSPPTTQTWHTVNSMRMWSRCGGGVPIQCWHPVPSSLLSFYHASALYCICRERYCFSTFVCLSVCPVLVLCLNYCTCRPTYTTGRASYHSSDTHTAYSYVNRKS